MGEKRQFREEMRWLWLATSELYRYARVLVVLMAEMRDRSTMLTAALSTASQ
jgi:hypothetical protein